MRGYLRTAAVLGLTVALSYVVRVKRWQRLLVPLAQVEFAAAVQATLIGVATTAVLPGMLGEVLRPYLLARRKRLSASAAQATVVLERLLDIIWMARDGLTLRSAVQLASSGRMV